MKRYITSAFELDDDGLLSTDDLNKLVEIFYTPWNGKGEDPYRMWRDDGYDQYIEEAWVIKPKYKKDIDPEFKFCYVVDGQFVNSVDIGDYEPEWHEVLIELADKYGVQ